MEFFFNRSERDGMQHFHIKKDRSDLRNSNRNKNLCGENREFYSRDVLEKKNLQPSTIVRTRDARTYVSVVVVLVI